MHAHESALYSSITKLRVGVIGDFAVDMYYQLMKETGEVSIETGKVVYHGSQPATALGGAGNVIQNLRALGVASIHAYGIVGSDCWGRELLYLLQEQKADTEGMLLQTHDWSGCAYVKPMLENEEENRLDFGSANIPDGQVLQQLFHMLDQQLPSLDILIINQQFASPLLREEGVEALNRLAATHKHCSFLADMRQMGHLLRGITLKVNPAEMSRILQIEKVEETDQALCEAKTRLLAQWIQAPVLLTQGENGMLYYDGEKCYDIPGIWQDGTVDPVGAGDTAISAFAVGMAAGAKPQEALELANLASAVTVKKLFQTGTASSEEIHALRQKAVYVYNLHQAMYPQNAFYYPESQIERVEPYSHSQQLRYAVVDHDGTISVLREGWEALMHHMMLQCICEKALQQISAERQSNIAAQVSQMISQTTGAPTLVQMEGLVSLIRQEGLVPEDNIQSPAHYKELYLAQLNDFVADRINRFNRGELDRSDLTLKGAVSFLEQLKDQGVSLFLASGTDEEYVIQEAEALGYASLFDGGIYGAKADGISAKKKVLKHLTEEKNATNGQLIVIGDGPSEIREGRKAAALCVGVASDEIRRYGLNLHKRERLIRAGAHLVIPDFSQRTLLLHILSGGGNQ